MTTLKEWMDAKWQAKGVQYAGHGVAYMMEGGQIKARAGTPRTYLDKETKRRRAKLAMYNEKLRPIILAGATSELRDMVIPPKSWKDDETVEKRPHYTWPKQTKPEAVAPVESKASTSIPRKRVPKAKLEQAAAIIAKVPQDELATFLARFGLSLSLAASIASLGDVEMIARQLLRATL